MASWQAEMRRIQAEQKRQERAAQKRQKDLERRLKEFAKLSAQEQARLEVESHENAVELLLSVHKAQSPAVNWLEFALALQPHEPMAVNRHEFAGRLRQGLVTAVECGNGETSSDGAMKLDQTEHTDAVRRHEEQMAEWQRTRELAKRVLVGEANAYAEAVSEFSSLADVTGLGTSLQIAVHSPKLVGCTFSVNGREIVPAEAKSLTTAGKLSVKTMPKARSHEIYQDYVCGCALRLAREILAILPVDAVLVTASVRKESEPECSAAGIPVLSIVADRKTIESLPFESLDPSDTVERLTHRGDVKASRKTGDFVPIVPLVPADLNSPPPELIDLRGLMSRARQLRIQIQSLLSTPDSAAIIEAPSPTLP